MYAMRNSAEIKGNFPSSLRKPINFAITFFLKGRLQANHWRKQATVGHLKVGCYRVTVNVLNTQPLTFGMSVVVKVNKPRRRDLRRLITSSSLDRGGG